jgi:hypothetical protein
MPTGRHSDHPTQDGLAEPAMLAALEWSCMTREPTDRGLRPKLSQLS